MITVVISSSLLSILAFPTKCNGSRRTQSSTGTGTGTEKRMGNGNGQRLCGDYRTEWTNVNGTSARQGRAILDEHCRLQKKTEEAEQMEEPEEIARRFIGQIGYKSLHERERGKGQQKVPLIYLMLMTHMHTPMDFSHTTEPRTDTPSKGEVFQNELISQPTNLYNATNQCNQAFCVPRH